MMKNGIVQGLIFPLIMLVPSVVNAGANAGGGAQAVAGLEDVARQNCQHKAPSTDPAGLAAALEGELGAAMGFNNANTIIGMIYADDPKTGARMWASTLSGKRGGCDVLERMLVQPVKDTLAEVAQ